VETEHYDLFVIGSGPAGQKGAIAAAKAGKRVGITDGKMRLGGTCLHTGTIPSKTLREAVLYFSGYRQRDFRADPAAAPRRITFGDLAGRVSLVLNRELEVVKEQLFRNRVDVHEGHARFHDPHTLEVDSGGTSTRVNADFVLIACGTRPAHSPTVPLDGRRILDSDQLFDGTRRSHDQEVARSLIVVGGGVIGLEYASMMCAMDAEVTVIDAREDILEFVDEEILEALVYHMRSNGATFRLGEKVTGVDIDDRHRVVASLESGKRVAGESLLYTVGRVANTDALGLERIGLEVDDRGRIPVDEAYRTAIDHIYAAGDVIGFPALASTSMEQGRIAASHMFGVPAQHTPELLPYGIYTVPEISMVGKNERQLTAAKIPYEIGIARFSELARGNMTGDRTGLLKLVFDPKSLAILGVHVIGDGATELVHIGQAAMALGGTVEFLRDVVFNYPTLAEAYKVAASDGLNRL
jgi:NAD(P) transhydrogenase